MVKVFHPCQERTCVAAASSSCMWLGANRRKCRDDQLLAVGEDLAPDGSGEAVKRQGNAAQRQWRGSGETVKRQWRGSGEAVEGQGKAVKRSSGSRYAVGPNDCASMFASMDPTTARSMLA